MHIVFHWQGSPFPTHTHRLAHTSVCVCVCNEKEATFCLFIWGHLLSQFQIHLANERAEQPGNSSAESALLGFNYRGEGRGGGWEAECACSSPVKELHLIPDWLM